MQVVTTAIIKGGTGKTTTAAALAQAAAADGKRVLAIDMDPQSNLTYFLGADNGQQGSYEILHGAALEDCIQQTEQKIDCIAASAELATERTLPASGKRLQKAIQPLKAVYDLIVIDTPPQIGELTYNALIASTGLLIPLETEASSLRGLAHIADIAKYLKKSAPELHILGTVIVRYNGQPKINRQIKDVIAASGEKIGAPLLGWIRNGIAVREAQALQQSLFDYAPKSKPAEDYKELYKKIMEA